MTLSWKQVNVQLVIAILLISVLEVTDLELEQLDASTSPTSSSSSSGSKSNEAKVCIPQHMYSLTEAEQAHFTSRLMEAFWRLHAAKPANPMLAPVCLPGMLTAYYYSADHTAFHHAT